jgi:peptidoglycan/LPS O-acetylase OafA/YrhL
MSARMNVMGFRHDINGLRAWAVIAVLLYHFHIPGFQGGFAGVDVFFVISGYLMTEIIFRRIHAGEFSFFSFYLDRAKRILPALAVLCATFLLMGWFFLPAYEYAKLGEHVFGSMGFFSNYLYLAESGYFEKSSMSGKWLQHTWSLSVEWQFYLLYPLLVYVICKLADIKKAGRLLAVLAVVSLGYCIVLSIHSSDAAFFLLPSRIWELLAGGLVYLFPMSLSRQLKYTLEMLGFALLLYVFNQINGDNWPGWQAVLPVLGAVLILMPARQASMLTANPPLQWIGTISYSLYLWHWPIAHYLHKSSLLTSWKLSLAGILASIVLAAISWVIVEGFFSKRKSGSIKSVSTNNRFAMTFIIAFSMLVCFLGLQVSINDGFQQIKAEADNKNLKDKFIQKYATMHQNLDEYYHFECGFFDEKKHVRKESIEPSCIASPDSKQIFLWGDSHAQAVSAGLRALVAGRYAVSQVATSQCKPSLAGQWKVPSVDNNCDYANQFALKEIARVRPLYVVMAQEHSHEKTDWDAIARKLRELGVQHIILLGPVPQWHPALPEVIVQRHWNSADYFIQDEALYLKILDTNRLLHKTYDASSELLYVSLFDVLCKDTLCQVRIPDDGELIVLDYGHMTPKGSVFVLKLALGDIILK